jgi:hypothetical protein
MKSLRYLGAVFAAACLMTVTAFAADPTGAWKWTAQGRNGAQDYTMKLELKGGALTGALMMPGRGGGAPTEVAISDTSFKDDAIAFSVVREFNGMKMVTKYAGKLAGDEIKGSIERPGRGEGQPPQKTDWLAKREAAVK